MNKIVSKYLNDPKWKDIMVLYSGLFENELDRESFILNVNKTDLSLATNCELSGLNENQNITDEIEKKALNNLIYFSDIDKFEIGCESFNTLLSLDVDFEILKYYKNCQDFQIKFLKTKINDILKKEKYQTNENIIEILTANQKYFISDLLQVISDSTFLKKEDLNLIINSLNISEIKPKIFELVLKIIPVELISNANWNDEDILNLCIELNNLELIKILHNNSRNKLRLKEIIDLKFEKIDKIKDCFFLYNFLKQNNLFYQTYSLKIINKLLESNNDIKLIFALILIKYGYDTYANFEEIKHKYSIYYNQLDKINSLNEQDFITHYQRIIDAFKKDKLINDAVYNIGEIRRNKIANICKYHYYLSDGMDTYVPFEESDKKYQIGDEMQYIIIFYDKTNNRYIGSTKQIDSKKGKLKFDFEYLNTIKIGDKHKCKIIKTENGITIKLHGIKKKTKIKILNPNFEYIEYENFYIATVSAILNQNSISVTISS